MNGIITSQTIPAWLVATFMILAGFTWLVSRSRAIRMDSRIFAITFVLEGIVFALLNMFGVSIEIREFFGRMMLILLSLSQSLPLTIAYMRSIKRHDAK